MIEIAFAFAVAFVTAYAVIRQAQPPPKKQSLGRPAGALAETADRWDEVAPGAPEAPALAPDVLRSGPKEVSVEPRTAEAESGPRAFWALVRLAGGIAVSGIALGLVLVTAARALVALLRG